MKTLFSGLWLGVRSLAKEPGHTIIVVSTLGAALGLATLLFAVIDGTIRASLPFDHPEQLFAVEVLADDASVPEGVPPDLFELWRDGLESSADLVAYREFFALVETDAGTVEVYPAAEVTESFLPVLGRRVLIGGDFGDSRAASVGARRALLAFDVWNRDFRGDPEVVGDSIVVNGDPVVIAGVMPRNFEFPDHQAIWLELAFDAGGRQRAGTVNVFGRMRGDRSPDVLNGSMRDLLTRDGVQAKTSLSPEAVSVESFATVHTDPRLRSALPIVMAAAIGVLLLACVNISSLLMVRMSNKSHGLAVRHVLGARRTALTLMIVAENLVPVILAGVVGLFVSWLGLAALQSLETSADLFRGSWISLEMNPRIVLVLAIVTVATSLTASAGPTIYALVTLDPSNLRYGRAVTGVNRAHGKGLFQKFLASAEVTLAVAVLIVTAMLGSSVAGLRGHESDIRSRGVVTAKLSTTRLDLSPHEAFVTLERVVDRLESLSDVEGAALISSLPAEGSYYCYIRTIANGSPKDSRTRWIIAGSDAAPLLGIPVIDGRFFDDRDHEGSIPVAVVNQSFVDRVLGGGRPIGQVIYLHDRPGVIAEARTIVGVVPDYVMGSIGDDTDPATLFTPLSQTPKNAAALVVKSSRLDLVSLESDIRAAIESVDSSAAFFDVETLASILAQRRRAYDALSGVFGVFGALSLVLVGTGIYGVVAATVRRRRREFGVRATLGATPRGIKMMVLRRIGAEVVVGVLLGSIAAYLAGRALSALLFGISVDGTTPYGVGVSVVVASATLAAYLPARYASRIDPKEALHEG